jgi:hypothetical protein
VSFSQAALYERRCVRTAKPCGPGRRCYGQVLRRRHGANRRHAGEFREAREARGKVRLPGEHGISRPTIAQGRPCVRRHLYAAVRFFLRVHFAQRTAGASRHPAFPAPFSPGGRDEKRKPRAKRAARRRRRVCETRCRFEDDNISPCSVIARSEATKQSRIFPREDSGLLRLRSQ